MKRVACPRSTYVLLCIRLLLTCTVFVRCVCSPLVTHAQDDLTRIYGAEDQEVPTPAFTGTLGQKDPAALQELIDYIKAVNITAWKGMQASGTFIDSSDNTSQALLTILNGDHFRLDVETPKGQRSIRIDKNLGETADVDGKRLLMPPATAKAGLLAFPKLLASTFPAENTSFVDRGQVQIDGKPLHRITVEETAFAGEAVPDSRDVDVTDLYFDPASHLLLKSVSAIQLDSADRQRYLVVVTYGDYQKVGESLVPNLYWQSLNGQKQWTLRLNQPNLQPSVQPSYFRF